MDLKFKVKFASSIVLHIESHGRRPSVAHIVDVNELTGVTASRYTPPPRLSLLALTSAYS
jgi:hypothetical protein